MNFKKFYTTIAVLFLMILNTSYPVQAYTKYPVYSHVDYKNKDLYIFQNTTYISTNDPVLRDIIIEALTTVKARGYILPKLVVTDKDEFLLLTEGEIVDKPYSFKLGVTAVQKDIIYINPYLHKYDVEETFNTIFHECGHLQHYHNLIANGKKYPDMVNKLNGKGFKDNEFKKELPEINGYLGSYACTNEFEFCACFYASMMLGKPLPKELLDLYLKLGGVA